mmetsp:Transcript_109420/g.349168  ORF Transcript_109420/g.349168 Transcript_109420/m.349168 type:complete len:373 (-) Transcript_109420:21-1139(-)
MLVMGLLESHQILRVLVGRVTHQLLKVLHALRHGRVGSRDVREVGGMLVVRLLQGLQLADVLVGGVPENLLDVIQALRHVGVLLMRRREGIELEGVRAMGRVVLGVRGLERLDLAPLFVGGVPHDLLQVVDAVGEGCMVRGCPAHVLESLEVLVLCLLQGLELASVLIGRVSEHLLEVRHAFRHGRMSFVQPVMAVLQPGLAVLQLCVGILERLEISVLRLVLARRVQDEPFDNAEAVREGLGHLAGGKAEAVLDGCLRGLQPQHFLAKSSHVADEGGGLLPDKPQLGLVQLHLLLVQGLDLALPLGLLHGRLHGVPKAACGATEQDLEGLRRRTSQRHLFSRGRYPSVERATVPTPAGLALESGLPGGREE